MSYVDLIIKYLSGDLNQKEASSFEEELALNSELKKEFEEVSAAHRLIRDQLQKRDEESFRIKLKDVMNQGYQKAKAPSVFQKRWSIPLSAACLLAILYIFAFHKPGNDRLMSRFYDPQGDPVLLAYNQNTRGEAEAGIRMYHNGDYQKSMEEFTACLHQRPEDKLIRIYYLLSAIELNRQEEAMLVLQVREADSMLLPDQALAWYCSLALLKSDRKEEALKLLHSLSKQQGPYQSGARKLEKVLLK